MQAKLIKHINALLPSDSSINDAIATALDISYDAAHRRTSGKSKLSLEESVQLASYFNCSLDVLKEDGLNNIVAMRKTQQIKTPTDLEHYFNSSSISVASLTSSKDVTLYYSAKDIPIFHTLAGNLLTRFKIYVWLRLLSSSEKRISFEAYKIPLSVIEAAKKLGDLYKGIPKTEIWDTTTFNSTLKQILFYYQAGMLSIETATSLCNHLSELLQSISTEVSKKDSDLKIYHNELLLMNNTVLIDTPYKKAFYVPFTFLSYFETSDTKTCEQAHLYIKEQLQQSKFLNTAGEREQHLFFKKIQDKIDALVQLISASDVLGFE
ncbi:hypothetical protein [Dokdonia sp. PRO95]|uniref:hypothetical protein n=1 Tax=Dokdonia sp. PRO95 TaxID=1239415 RepID=UPI00068D4DBC|nr:hypothetical protein [Dokdonia sp. PRO95]